MVRHKWRSPIIVVIWVRTMLTGQIFHYTVKKSVRSLITVWHNESAFPKAAAVSHRIVCPFDRWTIRNGTCRIAVTHTDCNRIEAVADPINVSRIARVAARSGLARPTRRVVRLNSLFVGLRSAIIADVVVHPSADHVCVPAPLIACHHARRATTSGFTSSS